MGNEKLRELARQVADKYHGSSKKEKSYLSRSLVQKVLEMDPPGRFLRRHPKKNHWEDLSNDDDKCREKCAQVLRDAVAYVGLKDPPPPRPAQIEQQQQQRQQQQRLQQLQQSPFATNRNVLSLDSHQQRQYPMQQLNPFAMSAASSSSIMNHHMMATGNLPPAARQFSFPNFNLPAARSNSLAPSGGPIGGYDSLSMPNASLPYAQMPSALPQSIQAAPQGAPQDAERAAKRRRFSNFFDQYGSMPQTEPTMYGYDPRPSLGPAMNSYPAGFEYQQQQQMPGPRLPVPRRDSLFGNLSITQGSDHSGPSIKDFELFPEITVNTDTGTQPPPKNDGDEFSSDFY